MITFSLKASPNILSYIIFLSFCCIHSSKNCSVSSSLFWGAIWSSPSCLSSSSSGGGFLPAYWSQLPVAVALTCPHTEESLRDSFVPPHSLSNTIITALKQSLCPLTRLREDPSSLFKKPWQIFLNVYLRRILRKTEEQITTVKGNWLGQINKSQVQ